MQLFYTPVTGSDKQAEHRTAHALLRAVLRQAYGLEDAVLAQDEHGKPFLPRHPEIAFNLSHCAGLAVCGVAGEPLGVDAEQIRPLRERVLRRVFAPEEVAAVGESASPDEMFFRFWTLKESFVKAIGIGISYPMQEVWFQLTPAGIRSSQPDWQFGQYLLQGQWVISCCVPKGEALPDAPAAGLL